jgi:hypothetical protein
VFGLVSYQPCFQIPDQITRFALNSSVIAFASSRSSRSAMIRCGVC